MEARKDNDRPACGNDSEVHRDGVELHRTSARRLLPVAHTLLGLANRRATARQG